MALRMRRLGAALAALALGLGVGLAAAPAAVAEPEYTPISGLVTEGSYVWGGPAMRTKVEKTVVGNAEVAQGGYVTYDLQVSHVSGALTKLAWLEDRAPKGFEVHSVAATREGTLFGQIGGGLTAISRDDYELTQGPNYSGVKVQFTEKVLVFFNGSASVEPGKPLLMRVTYKVPKDYTPGVYTSGFAGKNSALVNGTGAIDLGVQVRVRKSNPIDDLVNAFGPGSSNAGTTGSLNNPLGSAS